MQANIPHPSWLLLELTYRCPLQCPYCSNPIEYTKYKSELNTDQWKKVLKQGRELGCVQLGLSGGEPLVRQDLEEIIEYAHDLGYYSNLITSSVGMDEARLNAIKSAGIDHIQISFQASDESLNNQIAGTPSFEHKIKMAKAVKSLGIPLVFNVVVHRFNIDYLEELLELAVSLQADYVEIANTQYLGFAFANKHLLLPTREQLKKAEYVTEKFKKSKHKTQFLYVIPDFYEDRPKPCMAGWGNVFLAITPDGVALPCHSARILKPIQFPNVLENDLKSIWYESEAFNHFRGEKWMKQPCQTCPERTKDFGGCHCQAYLLTGDMHTADPVCTLTSDHKIVENIISNIHQSTPKITDLIYRNPKSAKHIPTSIRKH